MPMISLVKTSGRILSKNLSGSGTASTEGTERIILIKKTIKNLVNGWPEGTSKRGFVVILWFDVSL